jgi:NADPH:quinone reductase-like Zn-dependent oxidoreductase
MDAFIDLLTLNGRYVFCGGVAGPPPSSFGAHLLLGFHKSPSFYALSLNSISAEDLRVAAANLFEQASAGEIVGVVDEAIPIEDAARAHRNLEDGFVFGKVVLTVDSTDLPT